MKYDSIYTPFVKTHMLYCYCNLHHKQGSSERRLCPGETEGSSNAEFFVTEKQSSWVKYV